jgi:hypothetical protein
MRSLEGRKRTGVLTVAGGSKVWFFEGRVYLASTAGGAPLSAVLFGADLGSLNEIETLFAQPEDAPSVIDQLLSARADSEPLVRRLLHEYNLNSLFELLVPSDAAFTFEGDRHHRLGYRLASETSTLLAQAEHRVDIWRRIAGRITSTDAAFQLTPALPGSNFERLVSADEWQYLACLNGRRTVADVITTTGDSAFRVCSTLYRLLLEGLIEEA